MTGVWWQYIAIFVGALTTCMVLTPVALRVALRAGFLDRPGGHKSHDLPVPYLGALAIVTAFSVSVVVAGLVEAPTEGTGELAAVLGLALVLALTGLVDDLRSLTPLLRFVPQLGCALVVWWLGEGVSITQVDVIDLVVTVLWLVGITNAFNLLDNMDGLSAGIAGIVSIAFFAIAAANGQYLVAGLSIALAGCSFGFLPRNFHPASIYMGDGGSYFLGFLIGYLGLKLRFDSPMSRSFVVPILACTPAVLDTTVVVCSRLWYRRNPLAGGQDHVSHRLVKIGLPVPIVVATTYFATAAIGAVSFVVARVDSASGWILTGIVFSFLVASAVLAWLIPVYPESKQRHFVIAENPENGEFPSL